MFQEVAARMVQQAETNANPSLRVYAAEVSIIYWRLLVHAGLTDW